MTLKADREHRATLKMNALTRYDAPVPKDGKNIKRDNEVRRSEKRYLKSGSIADGHKSKSTKRLLRKQAKQFQRVAFAARKSGTFKDYALPDDTSRQLTSPLGNLAGTSRTQDKATAKAVQATHIASVKLNRDMSEALAGKQQKYYKIGRKGLAGITKRH